MPCLDELSGAQAALPAVWAVTVLGGSGGWAASVPAGGAGPQSETSSCGTLTGPPLLRGEPGAAAVADARPGGAEGVWDLLPRRGRRGGESALVLGSAAGIRKLEM